MNDTISKEGDSVFTYCVLPTGCSEATCPTKLHRVFEVCTLKKFNVRWITEEDCLSRTFKKTEVLVFNEFAGEVYEKVVKTARSVFGPPCMLSCLETDQPLPLVNQPCYTAGMKDLDICTSSLPTGKKEDILKKITRMSGRSSTQMTTNVTHLVTDKVGSLKFKAAVSNGIPVMSSAWVEAVWKRSIHEAVHAIHPDFKLYTTPIFGGLTVTCSNMNRLEKEDLRRKIEANGGTFSGSLEFEVTDVLFITKPVGEKFKFALNWRLPILHPDWVYASLEKGNAVPYSEYAIQKDDKSSTPVNKQHSATLIDGNASVCSTIAHENDETRLLLSETALSNSTVTADRPVRRAREHSQVLEKLDLIQLKRSGPFLDGLKVYLSGFDTEQTEKLRRIINASGATRFTSLTDLVSHVIVGAYVDSDKKEWVKSGRKALIVPVRWLSASGERGKPATECEFEVPEWSSEVSVTRRSTGSNKENNNDADPSLLSIVQQYALQEPQPRISTASSNGSVDKGNETIPIENEKAVEISSGEGTCQPDYAPIFRGCKFWIEDLAPEEEEEVHSFIETRQGDVDLTNYNFKVLPVDYKGEVDSKSVTLAWISDCCDSNEIIPIEFYHRPLPTVPQNCTNLLKDVVLTVSGFAVGVKRYVELLAAALGTEVQVTFSKSYLPQKDLKASTHLCCAFPEGKKYEAAIKWNVPAVRPHWLQACLVHQKRMPVAEYSVDCEIQDGTLDLPQLTNPVSNVALGRKSYLDSPAQRILNAPLPFQVPTPETPAFLDAKKRRKLDQFINDLGTVSSHSLETPPKKQRFSPETVQVFKELNKATGALRINSVVSEAQIPSVPGTSNGFEPTVPQSVKAQARKVPFQGENVTVYVGKKTPDEHKLHELAVSLGGNVSHVHDENVTHLIIRAKSQLSKEIKLAKDYRQYVVHPDWLYACEDGMARIPEELYPFNLDPKMSLAVSPIASQKAPSQRPPPETPQSSRTKTKRKIAEVAEMAATQSMEDPNTTMDVTVNTDGPSVDTQDCLKQLQLLEQVLSDSKNRPSSRSIQRRPSDLPSAFVFEKSDDIPESQSKHPDSLETQSAAVTWADPRESTHQAIMERQRQIEAGDLPALNSKTEGLQPPPVVVFSGLIPDEKSHFAAMVKQLGGRVSESSVYDPATTHLVTPMLGRNEKQLGCIAAGKWMLRPQWLEESSPRGKFVEEEKYEWGKTVLEQDFDSTGLSEISVSLAKAAYLWRNARQGETSGRATPYHGMRAILHTTGKKDAYARLIEAGGGKIVEAEPPYTNPGTASVVLDDGNSPLKIDYEALARKGIACIKPNALHDLLSLAEPPSLQKVASTRFAMYIPSFSYAASKDLLGWAWSI